MGISFINFFLHNSKLSNRNLILSVWRLMLFCTFFLELSHSFHIMKRGISFQRKSSCRIFSWKLAIMMQTVVLFTAVLNSWADVQPNYSNSFMDHDFYSYLYTFSLWLLREGGIVILELHDRSILFFCFDYIYNLYLLICSV